MLILAYVLVMLVALLHLYFLVLEMFLWTRPLGLKTFRNTLEKAVATRVLAANMGLYNGFLAAGLLWSMYAAEGEWVQFFLGCVIVAGVFGALTVSWRILLVQALPAVAAFAVLWML